MRTRLGAEKASLLTIWRSRSAQTTDIREAEARSARLPACLECGKLLREQMHFETVAMLCYFITPSSFGSLRACHKLLRRLPGKRGVIEGKELAGSLLAGGRVDLYFSSQYKSLWSCHRNEWAYLANDTVDGVRNIGESLLEAEELSGFVALGGSDRTRRCSVSGMYHEM